MTTADTLTKPISALDVHNAIVALHDEAYKLAIAERCTYSMAKVLRAHGFKHNNQCIEAMFKINGK